MVSLLTFISSMPTILLTLLFAEGTFEFAIELIVLFWMNLPFGQTLAISVIGISLMYIILPSATGAWSAFSYQTIDKFISLTPKWSEISKESPGKSYLPHS